MEYDPQLRPGLAIDLPTLHSSLVADAHDGGTPIDHTRFSIVFNAARGFAFLTAHTIDGDSIIAEGDISRRDRFRLDPDVDSQLQVDNDRGYRGADNPWDRGHLVRRRSLHWGSLDEAVDADRESFFWTNIAPQHRDLHSGGWGPIEDWMLDLADTANRRASVFTGPVLTPHDPEITNRPGERPVQIPAGFWKVVAIESNSRLQAAGFLVWQRDFDQPDPVEFSPALEQVRLTTIEPLTGLSFGDLRQADALLFTDGGTAHFAAAVDATEPPGVAPLRPAVVTGPADIVLREAQ